MVAHGTEACNYLLAVDVDMNTVDGYEMSSWETGYGDFVLVPDLATLRDAALAAGHRAGPGRRAVAGRHAGGRLARGRCCKAQLDRLAERGWTAYAGTELEFIVFEDSYEQAWDKGYRDLTPANRYNVDYSMLGTARVEPLLREIRNGMAGPGMTVESAKGECNLGQHEIAFRYADALTTCDNHVDLQDRGQGDRRADGMSLTFMAKPNDREGNSCHIHLSVRDADGQPVMAGDGEHGLSAVGEQFIAGQLAALRELTLCTRRTSTPTSGTAGQLRADRGGLGAWTTGPARCGWSGTGRRCGWRTGCPGGDVNPYLAVAGHDRRRRCTASSRSCRCEAPVTGNAYGWPTRRGAADAARGGRSCGRRRARWPARRSGTRWWRTTPTWPGSSWTPTTPR